MRLSILFLALLFSCTSKKGKVKVISNHTDNTVNRGERIINHADTILNRPIGHGFYKNDKGDIFKLKRTGASDDSLGWYRIQFLDSTIKDGDWDKPGQLKNCIDIDTYTDTVGWFSKDKNHVYFFRSTSDGEIMFVLQEADASTFRSIKGRWARDKKYIFFHDKGVVAGADIKTFYVYDNTEDTARDKRHIYAEGERISK